VVKLQVTVSRQIAEEEFERALALASDGVPTLAGLS
jgi:hypothetical protein